MRQPQEVIRQRMPLPEPVEQIHRAFRYSGFKVYVVGGAVRDFAASLIAQAPFAPKDFDLVTGAPPDAVEQILIEGKRQRVLPARMGVRAVGKAFGVILVSFPGHGHFEIATFRKDAKTGDGRRPDSVTFSTLPEDADRRDLTINALYYSVDDEEIIDFHGGIQHLRDRVVEFVGDPAERLMEDRLRALRFARFFGRINPEGPEQISLRARAAIAACELRPAVSEERIRDEFLKGLASVLHVPNFIRVLEGLGLLTQVFPGFQGRMPGWVEEAGARLPAPLVIAQMLHGEPDAEDVSRRLMLLKYTTEEASTVWFLLKLPSYARPDDVVDFKRDVQKQTLPDALLSAYAHRLQLPNAGLIDQMLRFAYPNIKGDDLLREGFQGRELGREMREREVRLFRQFLGA